MTRCRRYTLAAIMLATVTLWLNAVVSAGTMTADQYYTWGIDSQQLQIPEGSTITEAVLTIKNITNWDNQLNIHLVDNPPLDFVANTDHGEGDFFQDFGGRLSPGAAQKVGNDLVITFSAVDDEHSWVRQIYEWPFNFRLADGKTVAYSSALLELIDYAGNGTPFGIGFDPEGGTSYSFSCLELKITVSAYQSPAADQILTFTSAPDSFERSPLYVLNFDGVDDLVQWSNVGAPVNNFTMAAWVKTSVAMAIPVESNTINSGMDAGRRHLFFPLNGEVGFAVGTNGIAVYPREKGYMPALAVYQGTVGTGWNYIAVTYANGQPRIYLNGTLVRTGLMTAHSGTFVPARRFGGYPSSAVSNFKGQAQNVRVWATALSAQQVGDSMVSNPSGAALFGYWKLNEGTGTTAYDSSGNDVHAVISGASWMLLSELEPFLQFDGVDDLVQWSNVDAPVNNFTMAAWVKTSVEMAIPVESNTINSGMDAGRRHLFFPLNGEVGFAVGTNGIAVYPREKGYMPALAVYQGTVGTGWNYIAVTYSNGQPRIYLNGTLVRTGLMTAHSGTFVPARRFGGYPSSAVSNFKGQAQNVRVWATALSAQQVADSMVSNPHGAALFGQWKLDEGAGTTAYDTSGNGRDAVIYGATWMTGQ